MRFTRNALIYWTFAATAIFVAACNSSQTSMPSVGGHGGSIMKPALDGIVTGKEYRYHGCKVYGLANPPMSGDPYANADITNATVDSNSSSILSFVQSNYGGFDTSSDASYEIVNIADSSTPVISVTATPGGHAGPLTTPGPPGTSGTGPIDWNGGVFRFEGTQGGTGACTDDCHWITLNKSTCVVYQGAGGSYVSSVFSTYNGFIDDLTATYASQFTNKSDNWSVAGIPGLGFTDFGEDFALTSINHPLQVIFPVTVVSNIMGDHVNLSPHVGGDGACDTTKHACLKFGDILRLKSTVSCGSDTKTALVCNQLKTYGAMVADTGSDSQFRFGLDSSGNDPIGSPSAPIWTWMGGLHATDFQVITRDSLVP